VAAIVQHKAHWSCGLRALRGLVFDGSGPNMKRREWGAHLEWFEAVAATGNQCATVGFPACSLVAVHDQCEGSPSPFLGQTDMVQGPKARRGVIEAREAMYQHGGGVEFWLGFG
jgi:hypothetical protein